MSDTAVRAQSFTLTLDGVKHTLAVPLEIRHTIRLRAEVGWSQAELYEFLAKPDLDTIAVCVWLARLQAGEQVAFDAVARTITYDTDLTIGVGDSDHPES